MREQDKPSMTDVHALRSVRAPWWVLTVAPFLFLLMMWDSTRTSTSADMASGMGLIALPIMLATFVLAGVVLVKVARRRGARGRLAASVLAVGALPVLLLCAWVSHLYGWQTRHEDLSLEKAMTVLGLVAYLALMMAYRARYLRRPARD